MPSQESDRSSCCEEGMPPITRSKLTSQVNEEQRRMILKKLDYNVFSFPADMLNIDYLSDSGALIDI